MPIRRPNENDPDWMAKKQDKELIYLEERISALYEEASHDVTEEYERFWESYQLEYDNRLAMVESGEITDDAFQNWCRHQIFRGDRYRALIRELTDVLTNADVAAMAAVNEQLPYTLAESYDFISSLGFEAADQAGISMGTFQIYNADSVREIIRQNPSLFPVVDLPEDEAWNRRHINNEIMQAIIQGDSMQQVARRLQSVAAMDNRAAIRNARTAMTAAENLGRSESARRLKQKGLPVKEVWSATKDSRTRNTHLLLDGTEKDANGYYGADILRVPLRFPADPNGEPQEIYNCRCRDNVVIAGLDHSKDDDLYENFMRENYPEDWQALQQREAESGKADERREALERQARLREEAQANKPAQKPAEGYQDANDLERAIMADGGSLSDPRLLAYSNTLEEENKYNTSLRNNLQQAINENGYTEGIRGALEAEERDAQRYLDNLPEFKTPEQIATAEAMEERLRILAGLKPAQQVAVTEAVSIPVRTSDALPSAVRERYDAFAHRYAQGKVEHSMLVRGNGEILFESSSRRRDNAPFAPSYSFAESLPADTYSIHNHPANEIFSWRDIQNYELYGVSGTITTPDGWEYTLFNNNPARWNLSQTEREETEWLNGAFMRAREQISDNWLANRRAYIDSISDLPREERITLLRTWEDSHSTYEESIQWLEAHAEEYGFIFRRRRING